MKVDLFTMDYVRGAGRSFDKMGYDLIAEYAKKGGKASNPLYVLLASLGGLQKRLDRFVRERQNSTFIQEEAEEGILLVNKLYRESIGKELKKVEAVIDRIKAAEVDLESRKDPNAELLKVTQAMNRYGGMTDGELRKEADRYVTTTNPENDIQVLDALSKELKQRGGLDRHEVLRKSMKRNNAGELWRSDQVAKAALQEIGFYEGITPGRVSFKVAGSDGKTSTLGFKIMDLVQIKNLSQLDERATA